MDKDQLTSSSLATVCYQTHWRLFPTPSPEFKEGRDVPGVGHGGRCGLSPPAGLEAVVGKVIQHRQRTGNFLLHFLSSRGFRI